jgi:CRP-like cAMP-binding protein
LHQTDRAFADVALLELPVRLAKVMLRIINREAKSGSRQAKIHFSQRELANMVGGTRESVNKCLRNWQRNGLIQISEGSIVITDPCALEELAEMSA